MVEVDAIEEAVVRAHVYVETESQKGILVGKRGAMVREIGTRARPEALVGHPVFLELGVKVRPKWRRDPRLLERLARGGAGRARSVASSPSSSAISRASRPCSSGSTPRTSRSCRAPNRRREGRGHAICGALRSRQPSSSSRQFVALTAIVVGTALGASLAWNVSDDTRRQPSWAGMSLYVPWANLLLIFVVVVAYAVALLATLAPAGPRLADQPGRGAPLPVAVRCRAGTAVRPVCGRGPHSPPWRRLRR